MTVGRPCCSSCPVAAQDQPHPRTASSYRVGGVLEGSGCDLHSMGLRLNAETGEISGTPTAEEPVEVECVIQAVQDDSKGLIENSTVTRCIFGPVFGVAIFRLFPLFFDL